MNRIQHTFKSGVTLTIQKRPDIWKAWQYSFTKDGRQQLFLWSSHRWMISVRGQWVCIDHASVRSLFKEFLNNDLSAVYLSASAGVVE